MQKKSYERTTFTDLVLSGEELDRFEFLECTFKNCSFTDLKLMYCMFQECRFENCRVVNMDFHYCTSLFSELVNCSVVGVDWGKLDSDSGFGSPLQHVDGCMLKYNMFARVALRGFSFAGNSLVDSTFAECDLQGASFVGCDLNATGFIQCDLRKTDFRDASGYEIDPTNNRVKGARFSFPEVLALLNSFDIVVE